MITSDSSDSAGGDVIFTPASTESPSQNLRQPSPLRIASLSSNLKAELSPNRQLPPLVQDEEDIEEDLELEEMDRPSLRRPSGGHSHTPLLYDGKEDTRGRRDSQDFGGTISRTSTFRSSSPKHTQPENLTRRKYMYAGFFLMVSLVSFVVQTETAVYIQHTLHWDKAYCMLWLTHGSWSLLWPIQLLCLRIQKRKISWGNFWRKHAWLVHSTGQMVQSQDLHLSPTTTARNPWPFLIKTTCFITTFLTVAGGSWYVAINMTSPSDLTAIYNCSAFFAYVFSIMLLGDKLRMDKMFSVGLAIAGVLIVAYGDKDEPKSGGRHGGSTNPNHDPEVDGQKKVLGNLIIGVGSVMYGLYEVLYKKYACPPEGTSPGRGMVFANTFGSMIGCFTLCVLWIPLPILHWTGIERFELPRGQAAYLLAISTLSNAIFSGSFLVLMSLTSPVLSSVAALLTIFLVAITDWLITGKPLSGAAILGGGFIIVAFGMLSFATYREMQEEQRIRDAEGDKVFDDEDLPLDRAEEMSDMGEEDELGRNKGHRESVDI